MSFAEQVKGITVEIGGDTTKLLTGFILLTSEHLKSITSHIRKQLIKRE